MNQHNQSSTDAVRYSNFASSILDRNAQKAISGANKAAIAIYRNNVRAAYNRVLGDTFPIVKKLVGEDFFKASALEYFYVNPPASRMVARYGDGFPEFLETFPPAASLPYLADVARMEKAWIKAYHAQDAAPADAVELLNDLGGKTHRLLRVLPSLQLLHLSCGAFDIWSHNKAGSDKKIRVSNIPEWVIVYRPRQNVLIKKVDENLFNLISQLVNGAFFDDALDVAANGADATALILEFANLEIICK